MRCACNGHFKNTSLVRSRQIGAAWAIRTIFDDHGGDVARRTHQHAPAGQRKHHDRHIFAHQSTRLMDCPLRRSRKRSGGHQKTYAYADGKRMFFAKRVMIFPGLFHFATPEPDYRGCVARLAPVCETSWHRVFGCVRQTCCAMIDSGRGRN